MAVRVVAPVVPQLTGTLPYVGALGGRHMRAPFLRITAVLVLVAIAGVIAVSGRQTLGLAATRATSPVSMVPLPAAPAAMDDTLHLVVGDTFAIAAPAPADSA